METIEVVNLALRSTVGLLSLAIGYEGYKLYVAVGGIKLSKTLKKISYIFVLYGIARLISGILDYAIGFDYIYFSVVVHDVAFLALWWILRSRRKEFEDVSRTDTQSINSARDNIERALSSVENILSRS